MSDSPDDIAISVRNLTKTYRLFSHPGDRIKQAATFGLRKYHKEFTALKDVSFDIKKGETVGIIGRNGSGKSTLLQLICGILKPTSGTVQVYGRVSALLELGAGFNPEFTGRENVYFQGALMGFTRSKMEERFDAIASFADIGEFIDQPVRTYSSGMFVRLAFATAISFEPDILVVDEALAVGDMAFQAKCLERIDDLRAKGCAIVLVSHILEQVAHHCHKAYLLDRGLLEAGGETAATLAVYLCILQSKDPSAAAKPAETATETTSTDFLTAHPWYSGQETRWGDGKAYIVDARIAQGDSGQPMQATIGKPIDITFDVAFNNMVSRPIFGLTLKSSRGVTQFTTNSRELAVDTSDFVAGDRVRVTFRITPWLDSDRYLLSFGVVSESSRGLQPHDRRYDVLAMTVTLPRTATGEIDLAPAFRMEVLA